MQDSIARQEGADLCPRRLSSFALNGSFASLQYLRDSAKGFVHHFCRGKLSRNIGLNYNNIRTGSILQGVLSTRTLAKIIFSVHPTIIRMRALLMPYWLCFHILLAQAG
jgi:hypothetical protein